MRRTLTFRAEQIHERAALPGDLIMPDQLLLTSVGKIGQTVLKIDILRPKMAAND